MYYKQNYGTFSVHMELIPITAKELMCRTSKLNLYQLAYKLSYQEGCHGNVPIIAII